MTDQYPAEIFTKHFTSPDYKAKQEVDKQNKPGGRPGVEREFELKPIDDIYANGKPYKGSGKLEGKVAWISGGDSGIGRATAILFALEGADSTIVYVGKEQKDAEDTRDYIAKKTNGQRKIHLVQADLKSEAACKTAIDECLKAFGRLDILVNNHAQQLENRDVTTLDSKQWEDTFKVNFHSFFYVVKAALPHMKKGSSIINMASINAFIGRPDLLDYTSTKGALVSFTRGLSNQILGERQIRVNAIAPGPVWTPLVPSTFSKENISSFDSTPMGRPGQPVEIATCCVFLASEDSSFISGNTIHPNGGVVIS
ncbi:short-chain dehydrogenase reductase family [Moniliophthora roreri MCA 2997]|uniref:Short-chain dehydrogenase reductase family n=1 Tax=Moniliophthora roreri (strain MCA 2997) TaxID=1381753 RepID=V2X943_MONRO|nr:short-chain dehydrogenase reductase family [Moniliophthora roreri MCA 2997]